MPDNPYLPPAPVVLVQMLRIQAWKDDIDDDSRKFHEWSADTIEDLCNRLVRVAKKLEALEAAHS
jgi:hypothetical protein